MLLLCHPHNIIRRGLALLIQEAFPTRMLEEIRDFSQVVSKNVEPELLIFGSLGDMVNDKCALRTIVAKWPHVKILAISDKGEEYDISLMMCGVHGVLTHNCENEDLANAVETVINNGCYFNREISVLKLLHISDVKVGAISKLNQRERDVLTMLTQDINIFDIAKNIFLSPRSVQGIISDLYDKFEVRSRHALIIAAVRLGEMPPILPED